MSGVIRALLGLAADVESSEGKCDRTENFRAALGHVAALLRVLPPSHELASALAAEHARLRQAEGSTPRVERLRGAYTQIEGVLEACFALSLSHDSRAVDTAAAILNDLVAQDGDPAHVVRRGDVMAMDFLGASILASYPNGMKLELTLRKAHPDKDGDIHQPGYWIMEGGVFSVDGTTRRSYFEESFGPQLPRGIETRLKAHLRTLVAGCASSVVTLVTRRADAAGGESARALARR